MIIDTDKLEGLSTDDMRLAIRHLNHAIIIKSYNVRVIPEVCDTLGIRKLDDK